jgi:primary-amine oxidase
VTRATLLSLVVSLAVLPACQAATPTGALAPATSVPGASVRAPSHPLDPLTADEIRTAVATTRADSRLKEAAFPSIQRHDPPKTDVLAWQPGQAPPRVARIQAMVANTTYEVLVDVGAGRLLSVTERPGAEPSIIMSEIMATAVVLANAEFVAGLHKRGVTDLAKVFCAPFSAGYYGRAEREGNRLVKVGCFDTRRSSTNLFGWPIERLYALVDLRTRAVVSVTDQGVVPIREGDGNYEETAIGSLRPPRKPTVIAQLQGSNVTISGHEVSWGKWRFHAGIDPRVGTVISLARWQDTAGPRSVLYQGYLSEMFVPYMDPDYGWQSRTYFDTGEYGAGALASPLKPGVDCPASASLLPAVFSNEKGEPFTTENALCIFERSGGDPVWRHYEAINQTYEGRANVELVVRMAATIGNYDYLFDWVFTDTAEIEVRVGATGIDALKGVATRRMSDATAAADTRYGTLVAPNVVAVNHDHFFNFRLDLDVDGLDNSFNLDVYKKVLLPPDSPRRSLYVVEAKVAATEAAALFDAHDGTVKMRVVNENRTNAVGNPTSYEVLASNHAKLLLDAQDWPARRARYLQHDVWVTPFTPTERYAAGEYVMASRGDDGLAVWAARNRPIRHQDLVVWVNVGMHHLTRAEDLPVMPTVWHSFRLRPHNFLDRNPAIDLRNDVAPK